MTAKKQIYTLCSRMRHDVNQYWSIETGLVFEGKHLKPYGMGYRRFNTLMFEFSYFVIPLLWKCKQSTTVTVGVHPRMDLDFFFSRGGSLLVEHLDYCLALPMLNKQAKLILFDYKDRNDMLKECLQLAERFQHVKSEKEFLNFFTTRERNLLFSAFIQFNLPCFKRNRAFLSIPELATQRLQVWRAGTSDEMTQDNINYRYMLWMYLCFNEDTILFHRLGIHPGCEITIYYNNDSDLDVVEAVAELPKEPTPPPLPPRRPVLPPRDSRRVTFSNEVDTVVLEGMGNPPKNLDYTDRSSASSFKYNK